jgi:hypothetical protein
MVSLGNLNVCSYFSRFIYLFIICLIFFHCIFLFIYLPICLFTYFTYLTTTRDDITAIPKSVAETR